MERKLFNTDFESLLKENADQFKMYPSKKVWHGIYNDMHPGRSWPSVTMSLFLVFTLVFIGHLNTQRFEKASFAALPIKEAKDQAGKTDVLTSLKKETRSVNSKAYKPKEERNLALVVFDNNGPGIEDKGPDVESLDKSTYNNEITKDNSVVTDKEVSDVIADKQVNAQTQEIKENLDLLSYNNIPQAKNSDNLLAKISTANPRIKIDNSRNLKNKANVVMQQTKSNVATISNNSNSQNRINKAIRLFRLRSNKLRWSYYFTPSVSYRILSNNKTNSARASSYYNNVSNYVDHTAAPGFEAGTVIKYSLSKKMKVISGLQLNYSSYNIQANNIHPMLATIMVNKPGYALPSGVNGISFFSNGRGYSPVKLHNYSFQASVPIGLEYIITDDKYVQFSAAASLQPSYVIASHSYLLSSDKRNYLSQPSLLRNFNMNTSAGLFVTFKSKWLDLQVGPQLRYQLLSTYKKAYPVSEHLINYGIKFSVSKTIK